jgi:hypothetical protein
MRVLVLLVVVGCWRDDRGTMPIANQLEAAPRDLSGAYWCSIGEQGFDFDRYPCVIRKVGPRFILAKLGGSQRFKGVATPDDNNGFSFAGRLFCPWGECDEPMHGAFKPTGHGELKGTFKDNAIVVQLVPAPDDAFGGVAYGGDGYGDPFGAMGGAAYGGAGYAGKMHMRKQRPRFPRP